MGGDIILNTKSLTIFFGGLCAVDHVDLYVKRGEIVGLIGPNGSGKSTFFNLITGIYHPTQGDIIFEDISLVGKKPHEIIKLGIGRTFQNGRLFSDISVLDNILIGMHPRQHTTFFDVLFRYRRVNQELKVNTEKALNLLSLFGEELKIRAFTYVTDLPHTDRKRVEICRALASNPKLLLLDEPTGGMSPEETEELMNDIRRLKEINQDLSLIIIEHDMNVIKKIAERVYVFNYGKKIAEGPYSVISNQPEVIEAYLGEEVIDASS